MGLENTHRHLSELPNEPFESEEIINTGILTVS